MRMLARARHERGVMNKLEARYAAHLEERRMAREIASWRFEEVRLLLAPNTTITPDFWIVLPDGEVQVHEVKGHWEDDARVKVKVAAERWHEFAWLAVRWDKRDGWQYETFGGHNATKAAH